MKNVMIGITGHDEKAYCFEQVLKSVIADSSFSMISVSMNYADREIHRIYRKNSMYLVCIVPTLRKKVDIPQDHIFRHTGHESVYMQNIVTARNVLREEALIQGMDYLFFNDADVVVEKEAIGYMLEIDAPVVTVPLPLRKFDEITGRRRVEISFLHLGAVLIHCDVLEKIDFRCEVENGSLIRGEDKCFYSDVLEMGKEVKATTNIRAMHFLDREDYPKGYANWDGKLHKWS